MSRAGRVYRKGSGWAFRVDVAAPGAARKQVAKQGFPTKRAAQQALDELKVAVGAGTWVAPSRITLAEYADSWIAAQEVRGLRPTTRADYADKLRLHVLPALGDRALQSITPTDLDTLYAALLSGGRKDGVGGGLSPRTVRAVHVVVGRLLADAQRQGVVPRNPAKLASPPSPTAARAPEMTVWTPAELGRFLDATADDDLATLWRLLAMTGLRRGEACGLRWEDLDLDAGTLNVRRAIVLVDHQPIESGPKTARSRRTVNLDAGTVAALRAHRARQLEVRMLVGAGWVETDAVFADPVGVPVRPDYVSKRFRRAALGAGVPVIRLHDLRHTHATHLLAAGVNARIVSERIGHSSVGFTLDVYGHVLPGQQADAAAAAAALVDEP